MRAAVMVSVDPGLAGTGVVVWIHETPTLARVFTPPRAMAESGDSDDALVVRAKHIAGELESLHAFALRKHPTYRWSGAEGVTTSMVVEFPQFQQGAGREMGWKTGSLQKLTFLVGVLAGAVPDEWTTRLVVPTAWKGQLPKDVVIRRMTARYGKKFCEDIGVKTHAWDALGIGDWALRNLP